MQCPGVGVTKLDSSKLAKHPPTPKPGPTQAAYWWRISFQTGKRWLLSCQPSRRHHFLSDYTRESTSSVAGKRHYQWTVNGWSIMPSVTTSSNAASRSASLDSFHIISLSTIRPSLYTVSLMRSLAGSLCAS